MTLDVPDRLDRFNDQAVSQAGTRLEPSAPFRAITGIGVDIQHDGNGAVTFEKADIDLTKGPLIVLRDGAGAAVPGVIDAVVQGY